MGRPGFGEPGRSSRKGQPPRVSGTRSPSDRRLVGQLVGAARRRPLASTSPSHSPPHHSCPPPYHPPNPAPAVPAGGAWRRRRRRRLGRARRSCGTSPPLPSTCSSDLPFQPDPVQGPDPGPFIGSRPSRAAPRRRKSRQKTTNYLSQQQIDTIKTIVHELAFGIVICFGLLVVGSGPSARASSPGRRAEVDFTNCQIERN